MRTIIAGSRNITDYSLLLKAIEKAKEIGIIPTVIVSGTARGVDRLGERWAQEHRIPLERFYPEWGKYGKQAGPLRNVRMAENADALIAIWDAESRGTGHMISIARAKDLKVFVLKL